MEDLKSGYNSFQTKSGNIIWAGALSLAWSQLKNKYAKENIKLDIKQNIEKTNQLVSNFNHSTFQRSDISPEDVYIKSGFGQQTVEEINREVKLKFKKKTISDLEFDLKPSDIICYAYICKQLFFLTKLQKRSNLHFLFNKNPVKSFYASTLQQKQQIKCHKYDNQENFIVEIQSKNPKDCLILFKSDKKLKMEEVIHSVEKAISEHHQTTLQQADQFEMPVIELDCSRQVEELIGCSFLNKSLKDYCIKEIREVIKLNIDECGAKMQNEGVIVASQKCCFKIKPSQPKYIILDRSFWIIMKEVKHTPYACFYINSPLDN